MGLNWYLDAWAVRDGMAFASQRNTDRLAQASRSVYIAVPGLDAVPMGSISAGLWAARTNFQDGLFDAEGEEIGLPDLEAVKELVRRGYLAGGIGPGPEQPGEPPVEPHPPDDLSPGERHFESGLRDRHDEYAGSKGIGSPEIRRQRFEYVGRNGSDTVLHYLQLFGEATILHWADLLQLHPANEDSFEDFAHWISILYRAGVLNDPNRVHELFEDGRQRHWWLDRYFPFEGYRALRWFNPGQAENIIFRVPCPLRSKWQRDIRFLSDKLLLAVSTIDYFDGNPELPEFVPSLLAAMAVVHQGKTVWYYPHDVDREARLREALAWLSAQMPQRELPARAEVALSDFAWGELVRR